MAQYDVKFKWVDSMEKYMFLSAYTSPNRAGIKVEELNKQYEKRVANGELIFIVEEVK